MTIAPKKKLFCHGNTAEEWTEAHGELIADHNWRALSFRGVLLDPAKGKIFVQLGCPGCDSTISKPTDIHTAMEAVTNASGICHRSLEVLTAASFRRRTVLSENEAVPEIIDDNVTARLSPDQQVELMALVQQTAENPSSETVKVLGDGWFVCICGNTTDHDGFYPCDQDGMFCEPEDDDDWHGHLKCQRCRRFFHQNVGTVLGVGAAEDFGEVQEKWEAGELSPARVAHIRKGILTCESDGGEVEVRDGKLFVRPRAGADWQPICAVGDHTIEIVGNGTVHLKRGEQVILAVTP